jgi:hypothetical protein
MPARRPRKRQPAAVRSCPAASSSDTLPTVRVMNVDDSATAQAQALRFVRVVHRAVVDRGVDAVSPADVGVALVWPRASFAVDPRAHGPRLWRGDKVDDLGDVGDVDGRDGLASCRTRAAAMGR